jgi:hypothetical protein
MSDELSDHSHFEELCALATVGEIAPAEYRMLSEHLEECASCRDSYADFREVVHLDLPLAIADEELETRRSWIFSSLVAKRHKDRFLSRARERGLDLGGVQGGRDGFGSRMPILSPSKFPYRELMGAVIVVLVVALVGVSYKTKTAEARDGARAREAEMLSERNASLIRQIEELRQTNREAQAALSETQGSSGNLAIRLRDLEAKTEKDDAALRNLEEQLTSSNARASLSEERLNEEREKLAATNRELATLRTTGAEEDRSAAGRRLQLADLSHRVKEQDGLIEKQQKLLEVDADVRNLMAARNLHITDVFDVDGRGKKQSAFGRVFYTEGKSLIFYAFDLNPPKGAGDKHSFQAWGQLTDSSTSTVNLGIFYVDDPAEKRWILKFDNPEVLNRLSAVFVTTEPRGGTARPTGTKLMYAYLGHEPNHP